jgi:hypothetical protein
MSQDHYLLSDREIDRLRDFFESFHYMVFEFIESRRVKVPPWEEDQEAPEMRNFNSVYEELDNLAQEKFDF